MKASRHLTNLDDTVARAERAARLMAANGYSAVRSHADTTQENMLQSIEALAEVKRRVADVIDLEIVALSSWPITGTAGAPQRSLMSDALDAGADLVGGCPHLEAYTGDGDIESATDAFLQIAVDHGKAVDLHTDETLDPHANGLEVLADRVLGGFDLAAPPRATASASGNNRSKFSRRPPSGSPRPASASSCSPTPTCSSRDAASAPCRAG